MLQNLLILFVLIVLSGFFSGSEVVLLSITPVKIRSLLKKKVKGAQTLKRLKESPRRMIIAILIGNNVVNIAAASFTTVFATQSFGSQAIGIATGILTFVILVVGEIIPKSIAAANTIQLALLVAPIIQVLLYVLFPIVVVLEWFTTLIQRAVKMHKGQTLTETDVRSLIELGVENKVLEPYEKDIMTRVLKFNDITAYEVMTPFEEMLCLDAALPIKDAVDTFVSGRFTRIPLFSKELTRITGIVTAHDMLKAVVSKKPQQKLQSIATEPIAIAESMVIDDVFRLFQNQQTHFAVVKNNATDAIIGIVTLEDLLEELVGEITHKADVAPDRIIRINRSTIVTHGDTEVARINRFFNSKIPTTKSAKTVHSLIVQKNQKPQTRDEIAIGNLCFEIEQVRGGKITKVRITRA